jgi:hypothetical protein
MPPSDSVISITIKFGDLKHVVNLDFEAAQTYSYTRLLTERNINPTQVRVISKGKAVKDLSTTVLDLTETVSKTRCISLMVMPLMGANVPVVSSMEDSATGSSKASGSVAKASTFQFHLGSHSNANPRKIIARQGKAEFIITVESPEKYSTIDILSLISTQLRTQCEHIQLISAGSIFRHSGPIVAICELPKDELTVMFTSKFWDQKIISDQLLDVKEKLRVFEERLISVRKTASIEPEKTLVSVLAMRTELDEISTRLRDEFGAEDNEECSTQISYLRERLSEFTANP